MGWEMPSSKLDPPSGFTGTFMKKLMLQTWSRLSMPLPQSRRVFKKIALHECIYRLIKVIPGGVAFAGAGTAQRVMAAAGVGRHREHDIVFIGANVRTRGDIDVFLFPHGVCGMVALICIVRVKKDGVYGLVTVKVGDSKGLPFFLQDASSRLRLQLSG